MDILYPISSIKNKTFYVRNTIHILRLKDILTLHLRLMDKMQVTAKY